MRGSGFALFAATCLGCGYVTAIADPTAAVEKLVVSKLPASYADFAVDPESGVIAAVDVKQNQVAFFGPKISIGMRPTTTLTLGNRPASVVFKQTAKERLFVVACLGEDQLYLVDATTLKQIAKIPVAASDISGLAVSQAPDDAVVYYNYGRGHDCAAGYVDLDKRENRGLAFDDAMDCAISGDGRYAYRRGPWSPSGFESLKRVEGIVAASRPKFERVFYEHDSRGQYVSDPYGQYTSSGNKLYSVTLEKAIGEFQMIPAAFFPDKPLVVGFSTGPVRSSRLQRGPKDPLKLVVASLNTYRNVAELELPAEIAVADETNLAGPGNGDFKFVGYKQRTIVDAQRSRIIIAHAGNIVEVPYATLGLPDEPFLVLSADTSQPIVIAKPNVIKLRTRDSRIKVELLDHTDGLALTARGLEFKPNESQIGTLSARFRLSHGEFERIVPVELQVEREGLKLSGAINRCAVAGRWCFGWSAVENHRAGQEPQSPQGVLINLETGVIVSQAALAFQPHLAAVDDQNVFLVQPGTGTLTVLDPQTLQQRKAMTFDLPIAWVTSLDQAVAVGLGDGSFLRLKASDLSLLPSTQVGKPSAASIHRQMASGAPKRTSSGLRFPDGNVYDAQLERLVLFKAPDSLIRLVDNEDPAFAEDARGQPIPNGSDGQAVAFVEHPDQPATLVLRRRAKTENVPGATHTWRTESVWVVEVFPSNRPLPPAAKTVTLAKSTSTAQYAAAGEARQSGQIAVSGDKVVCLCGGKLFQLPLASVSVDEASASPPAFLAAQSVFVVDDGPPALRQEVRGGTKPLQFSLSSPQPGLTINPANGEIAVDSARIRQAALARLCPAAGPTPRGSVFQSLKEVDDYSARTADLVKRIAGREPRGVPVVIPIAVQAVDATPRTARLRYDVICEVPRGEIDAEFKKLELLRAQQPAVQQPEIQQAADVGGGAVERMRKLEQRIAALEAQLELLTRLLQARDR